MKYVVVALMGLLCLTLSAHAITPEKGLEIAGRGCCSWHQGVCGCSGGRALCCDGSASPSCGCYYPSSTTKQTACLLDSLKDKNLLINTKETK